MENRVATLRIKFTLTRATVLQKNTFLTKVSFATF